MQFIDAKDIDYRYFERPYFITPADKLAGEGYVVIRDALRKTNKVGLAQVTIAGREWLVAIAPLEDGLVMEMLRYAEELRKPEDFFDEVPPEKPAKTLQNELAGTENRIAISRRDYIGAVQAYNTEITTIPGRW